MGVDCFFYIWQLNANAARCIDELIPVIQLIGFTFQHLLKS